MCLQFWLLPVNKLFVATCLTEVVEPKMSPPLSLTAQFNTRTVYMLTDDDDERLNNIYWLSTPMGDESDHEQEMVIDFISVFGGLYIDQSYRQIVKNKQSECKHVLRILFIVPVSR